jgi:hypothetical protein
MHKSERPTEIPKIFDRQDSVKLEHANSQHFSNRIRSQNVLIQTPTRPSGWPSAVLNFARFRGESCRTLSALLAVEASFGMPAINLADRGIATPSLQSQNNGAVFAVPE